jgi:hypothetical protein
LAGPIVKLTPIFIFWQNSNFAKPANSSIQVVESLGDPVFARQNHQPHQHNSNCGLVEIGQNLRQISPVNTFYTFGILYHPLTGANATKLWQ